MRFTLTRPRGRFTDDRTLIESLGRDHATVVRALDFLIDARAARATTVEDFHRHNLALDIPLDALTMHLAIAIWAKGGCGRCRNQADDAQWCDTGRRLWADATEASNAYLETTGSNFERSASAEWSRWVTALARLNMHQGIGQYVRNRT